MTRKNRFLTGVATLLLLATVSAPAAAYMGPGVGLGLIATVFGAIAAFFLMLLGLVWYPVKVMLRKRREKRAGAGIKTAAAPSEIKTDAPAS